MFKITQSCGKNCLRENACIIGLRKLQELSRKSSQMFVIAKDDKQACDVYILKFKTTAKRVLQNSKRARACVTVKKNRESTGLP